MPELQPKPKIKPVFNMTMGADCVSADRTDVVFREKLLVIDEPIERGGTNLGLSPVEVAVGALLGCTNVITHKLAKKHGVDLRDMKVSADVTFDRRGAMLAEEVEIPWQSVELNITATTSSKPEQIEKMQRDLPRFCPVSKLFANSGTLVREHWHLMNEE